MITLKLPSTFHLSCLPDDDRTLATEQIEPLPRVLTPTKKAATLQKKQQQKKMEKQEKMVKSKAKGMRPKGRISTPERKPVRTEPVYIPREEMKKKKGSHNYIYRTCCYRFLMLKYLILIADWGPGMTGIYIITVFNVTDVIVTSLLLCPLVMKL